MYSTLRHLATGLPAWQQPGHPNLLRCCGSVETPCVSKYGCGLSLLSRLPENRTCKDASTSRSNCICTGTPVQISQQDAGMLVKWALNSINRQFHFNVTSVCQPFELLSIETLT